jgi:hypothetical protein
MKKAFLLVTILFGQTSMATDFLCKLSIDGENVYSTIIQLHDKEKLVYAKLDGVDFSLRNKAEQAYEIEIYDRNSPSRTYIEGPLANSTDKLSYAFWNRDFLLETSCMAVK